MIKKLSKREKHSILAASGVLLLFILMQFIVLPAFNKRERLGKAQLANTEILEKMMDN